MNAGDDDDDDDDDTETVARFQVLLAVTMRVEIFGFSFPTASASLLHALFLNTEDGSDVTSKCKALSEGHEVITQTIVFSLEELCMVTQFTSHIAVGATL
jgi:hypothetical protein